MAQNGTLSRKQERAITALLALPTIRAAALLAGVSERSLYRWLQDDEAFTAAYDQARRRLVSHAVTRLQVATEAAVSTLVDVMKGRLNSPSARVAAAGKVLDLTMGLGGGTGDEDLLARIDELEAHIRRLYP